MENMHTDIRVYSVKIVSNLRPSLPKSIPVFRPVLCKKPRIQNQFYTIKARNFSFHEYLVETVLPYLKLLASYRALHWVHYFHFLFL